MNHDKTDKSLPTLFSDLTREIVDLIRKEVALARTEVSAKVSSAETGITSVALGAAVILAGLFHPAAGGRRRPGDGAAA
jgi:hypothetical protein